MTWFTLGGLAAVITGCVCLYCASGNQRLLAKPWPGRPAHVAAVLWLGAGVPALAREARLLTTLFTLGTALMLACVLLPYLGAFVHERRTRQTRTP